jgi:hypothetical protein
MPPGSPALLGEEAALQLAREFFAAYVIELDVDVAEIHAAEGHGVRAGPRLGTARPRGRGKRADPVPRAELFILERADDGWWHETHVAWNEDVSG